MILSYPSKDGKQQALTAKNADEVRELLKAAGQEVSEEEIAQILESIKAAKETR